MQLHVLHAVFISHRDNFATTSRNKYLLIVRHHFDCLRLSAASLHKSMRKDESVGPMPIYERPRIRTRENECSQQNLFSASCFFALIYVNCWNSASAHAEEA
jgi:hypothetical protein